MLQSGPYILWCLQLCTRGCQAREFPSWASKHNKREEIVPCRSWTRQVLKLYSVICEHHAQYEVLKAVVSLQPPDGETMYVQHM